MSEDHKRSIWSWTAVLLIGIPVLYIALFGPACWLTAQFQDTVAVPLFEAVYLPILLLCVNGPDLIGEAIVWYASLGTDGTLLVNVGDMFLFL